MDYQLKIVGYTTKMYMLISGEALSHFSREKTSSSSAHVWPSHLPSIIERKSALLEHMSCYSSWPSSCSNELRAHTPPKSI